MPIQLAVTIPEGGDWDARLAAAKLLGFAGVQLEVAGDVLGGGLLSDAPATAGRVKEAGLAVAAVGTDISLHHRDTQPAQRAMIAVRQAIAKAAELGATVVRVRGHEVGRGESVQAVIERIGLRLRELGKAAGDAGVRIAVANAGNFVRARELWIICEVADHPAVGVAWDVVAGAKAGEGPVLAVPTLNTRIALAQVWDAAAEAWDKSVPLGTGAARVKVLIERLRGIGYGGWVTYGPRFVSGAVTEMAADNAAAAKALRSWVGLPELGPDGQPVPKVEPAAKAAPVAKPAVAAATAPSA